jgi:hypothetical protein
VAETLTQKLAAEKKIRATQFNLMHNCILDLEARLKKLEAAVIEMQICQGDITTGWAIAVDLQYKINQALGTEVHFSRFVHPYREGAAVGPDQTEIGNGLVVRDEFIITRNRWDTVGKRMTKSAIQDWIDQYPAQKRAA